MPTCNNKYELPDESYSISDIQKLLYIMQKHEEFVDNPPINIYVNKVKSRIKFEIKTGYHFEH